MDWINLGQGMGCLECGSETSICIKCRVFFDQLRKQFLKKEPASCR